MKLRPYQNEGIDAIEHGYDGGLRRVMVVWPTGAGKTVLFSTLIRRWLERGKRALVLAHRDRLIQQAVEKVGREIKWEQMGIVKAEQNRVHAQCVVASVQTLARERRLSQMPKCDLIIIDEAHRSSAKNYRKIIEHVTHPDSLLLGVTATPDRTDGVGLGEVYEKIVHEVQLVEMIEQGYLVNIRAKNVGLPIDLSDVKTKRNSEGIRDFDQDQLVIKMEAANWSERVCDAWLDHASDRRTIVFVPRVAMGYALAERMRERGVSAAALDGSTPLHVQRATVADFERGAVQVLVNCDLFVEGADIPSINCVVMARPTKSRIVYCQAVGRGTRLSPETGKTDLLVLDVCGVTRQLSLCSAADLIGLNSLKDNETITQAKKRETEEKEEEEKRQAEQLELLKDKLQAQDVQLFQSYGDKLAKREFNWQLFPHKKQAFLEVAGKRWEITKVGNIYGAYQGWQLLIETTDYLQAKAACEEEARKILFSDSAKWRQKPASPKQIQLLDKLKISYPQGISAGDASNLIDARFKKTVKTVRAA